MDLTREVRCTAVNDRNAPDNTWAGVLGDGLTDVSWVLRATVRGSVDPQTGYLCDIHIIDDALRNVAAESLRKALRDGVSSAHGVLEAFATTAGRFLPPLWLQRLEWRVSPYTFFFVHAGEPNMVHLTRAFDFCAAHRLSCPDWSDDENRRVFGKCSNPQGHGHNYTLEVTLQGIPDPATGLVTDMPAFDRTVRERVLDAFDHRNLNREVPEFAALNPSVENIARAIWNRLVDAFPPARLAGVRVWETPRTFAECTAGE